MKKILTLCLFVVFALVCNAQNDNSSEWEMPCVKMATSDSLYIRAIGIGEESMGMGERKAMMSAQINARRELFHVIQAEYGIEEVTLDEVKIVCQEMIGSPDGYYTTYVAVEVPRSEIEKQIKSGDE